MAGQKLARDDRVTFAAAWRPRVSREVTPLINSAVASSLPSPPPPLCFISLACVDFHSGKQLLASASVSILIKTVDAFAGKVRKLPAGG